MAITHEFTASGGYQDVGGGAGGTISWSHTSSGGSDCIVMIGFGYMPDVNTTSSNRRNNTATVTYGGANAMFIGYSGINDNDQFGNVYWFAVQNPPSGSQTVQVSMSTASGLGHTLAGCSVSYRGVRGVHRVDSYGYTGGTATITSASAPGRKLVHAGANSGTTVSSYSQNMRYSSTTAQSVVLGDADGSSSVTFSWSRGSSGGYGSVVAELIPVDEPQSVVTIRSMGEAARNTGSSSSLGVSWTHNYDGTLASYSLAVAAVMASIGSGADTSTCSVTFGGQAMTELAWTPNGSGFGWNAVGFYYLSLPPTGTNTVSVTTGGGGTKYGLIGESIIFENVRDLGNVGNIAGLNVDVNNTVPGIYLLAATVNAAAINTATKNEVYSNGATTSGSGDYGLIQSTVGTGGTVNFSMSGTASLPMTQVMQINPNIYNRDFLHML
jgi:hypothetical protein